MLKNKLFRHTTTFILIVLASTLLFPISQFGTTLAIWTLLSVIIAANLINLVII